MKVRIYNNTLNPALWDGLKLKPDVAESLKSIGQSFYKDTELTAPIKDIIMVGSSANYNWSDFSDIDIHIVIDFKDDMVLKIKNALESESLVKLKKVLKDLYDMREVGLNKSGEFSTENIVFKVLRSRGHLDKLRNGINQIFDKKASLKES